MRPYGNGHAILAPRLARVRVFRTEVQSWLGAILRCVRLRLREELKQMEKKTALVAFSVPALILIFAGWRLLTLPQSGFATDAIGVVFGLAAAVTVGITVFFLRKQELNVWHALLISLGGTIVGIGLLILVVALADTLMGYR